MTEPSSIPAQRDPDLVNAEIALKRAARLVRDEARRTGTALAYFEGGKIKIEIPPDELPEESKMDRNKE